MLLRDEVDIICTPADVFAWLDELDRHYLLWHPDHISCNYIQGDSMAPGAVLFCQEYLHGRPHRFRMKVTRVVDGSRIEYSIGPGMAGSFSVRPAGQGVRFTAELRLGLALPLLSRAQDAVIRRLADWRIGALKRHMAEEGRNLKAMIEASRPLHHRRRSPVHA
ncbi:MAG: SRPBCC family protein [Gaiellales bacterium]|nr:MAG: SRPBCC family protein [Gaiellales bacterium]